MSHQQPAPEARDSTVKKDSLPPFITDCHRNAVDSLTRAFEDSRPLAIMIGEGKSGAAFVISRFVSGLAGDVVVVRIGTPNSNAIELMRDIVGSIGFDPKDMTLTDLEQIFEMFLTFQKTHNRRTIICVEETQDQGQWVLDKIRRLVETEVQGRFGLLIVLSGRPLLNDLLNEPPLNAMSAKAGKRISLVPFSLAETKEYLRRRVEGTGAADLGQVFTFNAVTAIQEFSTGIPDKVSDLCSKCLELADLEGSTPVTTALVDRAAKLIRLATMVELSNDAMPELPIEENIDTSSKLVAFVNDTFAQEQKLNGGHILIGRDEVCDIQLNNFLVSRHHALVVNSAMGTTLLDLGSKNGTYVNGSVIKKHKLQDNDKITVGECSIEFVAGNDHHSWYFDVEPTITLESQSDETMMVGNDLDMEPVESTHTLVSPRHLAARN